MWTCTHCGLKIMFRAVDPELDEAGFYFRCLGCGAWNELINVGKRGGPTEVMQPL